MLRQIYWDLVRALVSTILTDAKSSMGNVAIQSSSAEEASFLFSIARSAAITGVRQCNAKLLEFGLFALAMENSQHDYRESLIELTLLNHSAQKLGGSLAEPFARIEPLCGQAFHEVCQGFLAQNWRSLDSMGYVESEDRNGQFTYRQAW